MQHINATEFTQTLHLKNHHHHHKGKRFGTKGRDSLTIIKISCIWFNYSFCLLSFLSLFLILRFVWGIDLERAAIPKNIKLEVKIFMNETYVMTEFLENCNESIIKFSLTLLSTFKNEDNTEVTITSQQK